MVVVQSVIIAFTLLCIVVGTRLVIDMGPGDGERS